MRLHLPPQRDHVFFREGPLYYTTLCYSILHYITLYYCTKIFLCEGPLYYTTLYYSILHHVYTVLYYVFLREGPLYYTIP